MEQLVNPPPENSGRWLRRLGREEFTRLMGSCIETVLARPGGLPPVEARRMRWDVLRRFATLLELRTSRVRALTKSEHLRELERTHGTLQRERLRQDGELAGIERELVSARSEESVQELLPFEERELELALAADLEALATSADPRAGIAGVVARERARRASAMASIVARERERIELLERRLSKLRAAQGEMELALAELARRASIDGGLPSIYRAVQGLDSEASLKEAKTALLSTLFQQNFDFQKRPA